MAVGEGDSATSRMSMTIRRAVHGKMCWPDHLDQRMAPSVSYMDQRFRFAAAAR